MLNPIKVFGLVVLTACIAPAAQLPAFSQEPRELYPPQSAQPKQANESATVLLTVEGALEDGDPTLDDGSVVDFLPFEGLTGQVITIHLESTEFDTFLTLVDPNGQILAQNDNASPSDLNSQLTITLPANGAYVIVVYTFDTTGRGPYQLTVVDADISEANRTDADRLLQQGAQLYHNSQFREARQSWEQALVIYREIGDRQGEANTLGSLGSVYFSLGQYERAIDFHQQQLAIARELGDRQGEANSLGNLGIAYFSLSQYERAIDFAQQYLGITREIDDRYGEANALNNLGLAYRSLAQYGQAIDFHQQSLAVNREIEDRTGEANALGNLGAVYNAQGQYERAINFYQQALAIKREIGDRQGEAKLLGNLGGASRSLAWIIHER